MRRLKILSVAVSIVQVSILVPLAHGQSNEEHDLVKLVAERKGLMFDMQTAYLSLLSIRQGNSDDLASVSDHATTIRDNLNRFVELLIDDTATGQVPNSRAKPEIWSEPEDFANAVTQLQTASEQLAVADFGSGVEAFNVRFDAVAEACVGCHDLKPSSAGKFRSPKEL
jgi:cytochrome c556